MTLTKRDLVLRISEDTGTARLEVFNVLQKAIECIVQALARGEKVELRNFGVFEVKVSRPRMGRNPKAPTNQVLIPARSVVRFKPGKELRTEVLKLKAVAKTAPASKPKRPRTPPSVQP